MVVHRKTACTSCIEIVPTDIRSCKEWAATHNNSIKIQKRKKINISNAAGVFICNVLLNNSYKFPVDL